MDPRSIEIDRFSFLYAESKLRLVLQEWSCNFFGGMVLIIFSGKCEGLTWRNSVVMVAWKTYPASEAVDPPISRSDLQ